MDPKKKLYEFTASSFQEITAFNIPVFGRSRHSAVSSNQCLHIFGGLFGGSDLNENLCLLLSNFTYVTLTPGPKLTEHSASLVNNDQSMFVFGGGVTQTQTPFNNLWEYSIAADTWTLVNNTSGPTPSPRFGHVGLTVTCTNNCQNLIPSCTNNCEAIFIFGGRQSYSSSNPAQDAFFFHPPTLTYIPITNPTAPYRFRSADLYHSLTRTVFIAAGTDSTGLLNDIWSYSIDTNIWTLLSPSQPFSKREDAAMVLVPNSKNFLLSGGELASLESPEAFLLENITLLSEIVPPLVTGGGVTPGAVIGGAVGGAVFLLILVGIVVGFLVVRNRRKNGNPEANISTSVVIPPPKQTENSGKQSILMYSSTPTPANPLAYGGLPSEPNSAANTNPQALLKPSIVIPPSSFDEKEKKTTTGFYENTNYARTPDKFEKISTKVVPSAANWEIDYQEIKVEYMIGEGYYGQVYKGEWRGVTVAVKQLKKLLEETEVDKFLAEAAVMQAMKNHKNVVAFYGVAKNPVSIITEFCENGSLLTLLHSSENLTSEIIEKILKGTAAGMVHLHSEGIIHRDLAARNILLTGDREPKISDFGLSRVLNSKLPNSQGVTKTEEGPLKHLPPESLLKGIYSDKSDVWSYGVVIFEVIARIEPYSGLSPVQAATGVASGTVHLELSSELAKLLPGAAQLMSMCMKTEPEKRVSFAEILALFGNINNLLVEGIPM